MRKSLYILGQVTDGDVEWMIAFGERRIVGPGEAIIRQGQPVKDLYLIIDGIFRVTDERAGGQELARLGSGEIVGEMSFVDANPPSATVTAVDGGMVLALPRTVLQRKLDEDPAFAARFYRAIAGFLSDRLRSTVARLGYGPAERSLDEDVMEEDELDVSVLDSVHLAGERFKLIAQRLASA